MKTARECLTDQAERMAKRSCIELQAGNIGDNVALSVPMVDRAGGQRFVKCNCAALQKKCNVSKLS